MRAIFGLAPAETAQTIHPSSGAPTTPGNGAQGESSAMKPEPAGLVLPAVEERE
jgi:hypothetical protein